MSEHFSLGGWVVADVDVPANGISGGGRAELPVLLVPLRLNLRCLKSPGLSIDFREIRCRVSPFDSTYIAESRPCLLNVRLASDQNLPNHLAYLEIPFDRIRLATLNRLRNGGDVKLRLDLELLVDELIELPRPAGISTAPVWGLKAHNQLQARLQTVIPRSTWIEQVTPGTEFAKVHIIELPAIPIGSCTGLKASFDALQQAQKLESQGFYREAVGQCRIALEPFFEKVEKTDTDGNKKDVPALKAAWQTRLGKATYDWLNAALSILKGPANQAVHLSSVHFEQLETQMLLAITTAVVAYAIKTQPEVE